MGRLLIILGIIALVAGIGGMTLGFLAPFQNMMGGIMNAAISTPDAAGYCNPGETLEQESGASVYTPGQGYGRSVQYYCVDDSGNRRNVTDQFVENLMGDVGGIFDNVSGIISSSLLMTGLTVVGIVLLILGIAVSARRRGAQAFMTPGGVVYSAGPTVRVGGRTVAGGVDLGDVIQQAQQLKATQQETGSLTARLQQLEKAYEARLITREEYDRLRQQLLDSVK